MLVPVGKLVLLIQYVVENQAKLRRQQTSSSSATLVEVGHEKILQDEDRTIQNEGQFTRAKLDMDESSNEMNDPSRFSAQ